MNHKSLYTSGVAEIMQEKDKIKSLLVYLLDLPSHKTALRHLLEELAVTDADEMENLLQRLEWVINGPDDDEWLEEGNENEEQFLADFPTFAEEFGRQ